MKLLIVLCSLCLATFCYAASVTSLMNGTIKYLPEEGQIVKKGEVLIELSESCLKLQMEAAKVDINIKKEELKDLQTDIVRAKKLHEKFAVSLAALENTVYNHEKCKLELEKLKVDYKDLERKHKKCKLKAPFDCKVTKVLIIPNSGVELGQEILEVEKVSS
jgi:multidrug resistance efflux pump